VTELSEALLVTEVALLLAGLGYASFTDLKTREVPDPLWQGLGLAALGLGGVAIAPGGAVPLALWLLVGLLTLQHMFAWDVRLGDAVERYADLLELAFYVATIVLVALAAIHYGLGPSAVPYAVLALLATVVFARGLFELGILFGGADAKALMVAGFLVPVLSAPLYVPNAASAALNAWLPFAVNLLMDAALASIAIPIALAVRNVGRREFSFPRGFTGYSLPVEELPSRFVWVRDPAVPSRDRAEEGIETSEDDQRHRASMAADLRARQIRRVWVTPQIPFVVVMAVGALLALLAGNLLLDLFAVA